MEQFLTNFNNCKDPENPIKNALNKLRASSLIMNRYLNNNIYLQQSVAAPLSDVFLLH